MRKVFLLRSIRAATCVGFCALMSNIAEAADVGRSGSIKDVSVPPALRWTGFYVGGQIGHGEPSYDGLFDAESHNPELSGVVGGIHVGYNMQRGNWVFGIEGDFNWTDWQDTELQGAGGDFVTGNIDWLATARARLGIAVDRTLYYATAGVAFAKAEYTAFDQW